MNRHYVQAFLLSCVITGVAAVPLAADARQIPAASCVKQNTSQFFPYIYTTGYANSDQGAGVLLCGYQDLPNDAKENVNGVFVDVFDADAAGTVQVQVCAQSFSGNSIACGASLFTGEAQTGSTWLTVTGANLTDAWRSGLSYGSVYVRLPLGGSRFYGITTF